MRTEVAFERTFGSHAIAQLILFGAFLSLLKIFNGNFVAATRMLYAIGRRNLVHPSLGRVHATLRHAGGRDRADGGADRGGGDVRRRDPRADHRGRLAGGRRRLAVGLRRVSRAAARRDRLRATSRRRWRGSAARSASAIILMKVVPGVPGSFTRAEWIAFAAWSASGWCSGCCGDGLKDRGDRRDREKAFSLRSRDSRFFCVTAASACWMNASCGSAAEDLDLIVDDGLRHAGDAVLPREIGELRRFHRVRGDVLVGERHFVREADRPRTVRSSRCREHLHRHRLVDRGDARAVLRRSAASRAPPTSSTACTSEMNS